MDMFYSVMSSMFYGSYAFNQRCKYVAIWRCNHIAKAWIFHVEQEQSILRSFVWTNLRNGFLFPIETHCIETLVGVLYWYLPFFSIGTTTITGANGKKEGRRFGFDNCIFCLSFNIAVSVAGDTQSSS